MAHGHSHLPGPAFAPRPGLARVLTAVVLLVAAVAVVGMVLLWPDSAKVPKDVNLYGGKGTAKVAATVTQVTPFDCGSGGTGPDNLPSVKDDCAHVTASVPRGVARFTLDASRYHLGMHVGDHVTLVRSSSGGGTTYQFVDFRRGLPIALLALVFAILVVVVARARGLFALVGVAVTLLGIVKFVLPALLSGRPAVPVAVVGSVLIMIVVLYLAHGISIRTTSALFGTFVGVALTGGLAVLATGWSSLTGLGNEDDQLLIAAAPHMMLSGVVAASMVIAGLGVLNDVTVTQASAVWELRGVQPGIGARSLFTTAMRIGRDHIASSVYTLVFAYAGSAMTVLLLAVVYQTGLGAVATSEEVGQEVVRTMVGAIGLVLAVPVTTAFAVLLAPRVADAPDARAGRGAHRA